jgi:hypothetical protein
VRLVMATVLIIIYRPWEIELAVETSEIRDAARRVKLGNMPDVHRRWTNPDDEDEQD